MRRLLYSTLLVLVPRSVLACPVCFGQSDSPLAVGINYGILTMIGFIGSVLAGFAAFFVYLMRRAHLAEQQESAAGRPADALATPRPHVIGHGPQAQEGTF